MKTLLKKELTLLLCSPVAVFFTVAFLVSAGLMLWLFPGTFNILDSGYVSLNNFFRLATLFFIILIPALTMRSFSEEKKNKALDVLRAVPLRLSSLYWAKLFSLFVIVFLVLLSTIVYVFTLNNLSVPQGNIDINEILASYFCLLLFSLVFIAIGLFASSLTRNQIIAFVIAVFLNIVVFYGFDLLAMLFSSSKTQYLISSVGLSSHSVLMQKGVLNISDILLTTEYILLFSTLTIYSLSLKSRKSKKNLLIGLAVVLMVNILIVFLPAYKFDFTSDKRYTVSDYTVSELNKVKNKGREMHLNVYLSGDLNSGFQRLQDAINDILAEYRRYSGNYISYTFINPHDFFYKPEETYKNMQDMHMRGIVLNEVDREGKASRKVIYPYAQVYSGNDTIQVNLLNNIAGYTAEENLNASIENLEFEFTDAIRLLNRDEPEEIAFIEGHGEIPRTYVYDAEELLSKYYFVNRGQIDKDVSILDGFKVVIIAGPVGQFSESEKYILDQYIMSGGKVLWLIDGVFLSSEELENKGESPSIKNNTNLDDMLFTYGVRINPNLIQDVQCTSIYLTSGDKGQGNNNYVQQPWYYTPLLIPSADHPVTKDISLVKGSFVSSIDITDKSDAIEKKVLLTSSANSHLVEVPEMIAIDLSHIENNLNYFNQSFLPVAVALQGEFRSAFENRLVPDSIISDGREFKGKSATKTKMIIVSSSDIIRNGLIGYEGQTQILPMGYDRVSERQFGNRNFIVNAVNWLASDDDLFALRSKQQKIRLLNKQHIFENRTLYAGLNIVMPLVLPLLVLGGFYMYRRRKYTR